MARPINDPVASAIAGLSRAIETSHQNEANAEFSAAVEKATASHLPQTVRLYGIGANPQALTSDLAAIQKMASMKEKDNHISFADVATEYAKFVPAPTSSLYGGNGQSDRWELGLDRAFESGILDHVKLQLLDDLKEPAQPVSHPNSAYGKRRLSTSARAARAVNDAVLTSGNVTPGAMFRQFEGDIPDLNNPPRDFSGGAGGIPPGGNQPPGPPDEPPDDNDGILQQLLEFFQRMFGVRPDVANSNFLDTLANNLTSILGGIPRQAGEDGRSSSVATLMDTVADYFNVPRETEDATREAQENLRRSIDRLTEATNGAANGGTASQPQTRWQRFRSFFRKSRGRRGGIATATRIASFVRPVLTRIGNLVPQRFRNSAAQMGQNIVGGMAQRFGVPAATAARFGAALGPAAAGLAVLRVGLPILGAGISFAANGLKHLSDEAMKTTFALANYSGLLAHANAQLEVNREMRKFDMANRMGGLGAERLNQMNRLENAMQPWQIMGNNAGNMFGALVDSSLATVLEILNNLLATGMDINATLLKWFVPGDQGEDQMRAAAAKLRNPAADMPDLRADIDAVFGQNAAGMIDAARRLNGPRRPNNGGN